jgi:protein O-mannosyl-transferase
MTASPRATTSPPAAAAATSGATRASRVPLWAPALICLAALLAYHNSFHGPFVFDDASSIVTNPTIHSIPGSLSPPTTHVTAQGRPILNLSLAINYAIGGTAVEGYHAFNLLIHALAGLTLFGIVRRTLARIATAPGRLSAFATGSGRAPDKPLHLALAVAVLWTVHPLHTESVTYTIQRAESLMALFYLLTLYGFLRGAEAAEWAAPLDRHSTWEPAARALTRPRSARGWFTIAIAACLLGMGTKEVMATAPLMVVFFDRCFMTGGFLAAIRRRPGFYAALASTWILLAWLVVQTGGNRGGSVGFGVGVPWWEYWLTQFKAIPAYLGLTLWPHPLVFEYGSFWITEFAEIAWGVVVVFSLLGATLFALWRRPTLGFLGAWFLGILAPTSLAPGTTQMIVEHRMYLPLAALLVAGVLGVDRLLPRGRGVVFFAAAAGALILLTVQRNDDYRSELALWTDTVAKRPDNPLAHLMRAGAQERAGDTAGALASYRRTLELKPDFSIAHENLGQLLLKLSQRREAIAHLEAAVRLQPAYPDAHANLGNAYLAEGRFAEAIAHLERALELSPASAVTRYNLGNALAAAGLPADAVEEYQSAVTLDPGMAEAQFNLANMLLELDRTAAAITHYQAAIAARPGFAAAHYNLGNALAATGRPQDAVAQYQAALHARPDYAEAHHNLGSALFELGRLAEAARHYEEALRLDPDFPNARENLARVRARMDR